MIRTNAEYVLPRFYGLDMASGDFSQHILLSNRQHRALMDLVGLDDPEAQHRVVEGNLRLVVNIAKRYSDHGVALVDLVREGNRGLLHALESFEPEDGFHFAAYAARCVHQHIECAIMNQVEPE